MLDMYHLMLGSPRRASHVARYSGSPVQHKENVAEHSYYVSYFALMMGLEYEMMYPNEKIDWKKLLGGAIVHDNDETLTGDIVRPFKYAHPELRDLITSVASQAVRATGIELGIHVFDMWNNAKDSSVEGELVRLADLMSVISYSCEELSLGNDYQYRVVERCQNLVLDRTWDPRVNMFAQSVSAAVGRYMRTRALPQDPHDRLQDVMSQP